MKTKILLLVIVLFTIAVFFMLPDSAQPQYSVQEAFPALAKFSSPLEMRMAGDGTNRIFIVEQKGKIYVFDNSPTVTSKKMFLDISDSVTQSGGEMGLLGLAFHPNYKTNGYFFVNYTRYVGSQLKSFIARYQVSATNPDSAVKANKKIFLTLDQPYPNHNGGNLLFGPDGYLYASFGDGGNGGDPHGNGQNKEVLLGKILRVNVDSASGGREYSIPTTNPFYGPTPGYREEIFSYGMRNAWKMSFDSVSGKLWAADVGQGTWEEIDTIRSGGNYGWNIMEGNSCYKPPTGCDTTGLIRPVWQYNHDSGDVSITGGYVYRGTKIPALFGKYVYGDYLSGRIWALSYNEAGAASNELLVDKRQPTAINISSFGEDHARELYVVDITGGKIYKLVGSPSSVGDPVPTPQTRALLEQNYPNPFSLSTTFTFHTYDAAHVRMTAVDILGRNVATIVNEWLEAGKHTVQWDVRGLADGAYHCILQSGNTMDVKMVTHVEFR